MRMTCFAQDPRKEQAEPLELVDPTYSPAKHFRRRAYGDAIVADLHRIPPTQSASKNFFDWFRLVIAS
jgi:hypothetical protein